MVATYLFFNYNCILACEISSNQWETLNWLPRSGSLKQPLCKNHFAKINSECFTIDQSNPVKISHEISRARAGFLKLLWGRDWRISFWKAKTLKLKERFSYFRSSYRKCSGRKDALRNFAKPTRKHLCQSLFFNDVTRTLRPWHRYFSETFAKFPRTPFCRTPLGKDII